MYNSTKLLKKMVFVLLAGLTFGASAAQAATVYVSAANNSGVEDGSAINPFNTIQEGINAAVAGDTVLVAPGIYHGAIELKDSVLVASEKGPQVTIIDGDGSMIVINPPYSLASSTKLEGFTVRNGTYLVYLSNRNNFWSYSEIRIRNCVFTGWGGTAIDVMPMAMAYVTQSLFYNPGPANAGTEVYDGIWCSRPEFTNVTIDQVGLGFMMYQTSVNLTNTTVSNVTTLAATWGQYGSGYLTSNYSNFYNITNDKAPGDRGQLPWLNMQNTMAVDPLFVNAAMADYHLRSGSPLIDAGINVGLPFIDTAPDIGAYEVSVSIPEMVEGLAHSYQDVPLAAYKNAAEQRRDALQNKFKALLKQIAAITDTMTRDQKLTAWQDALDKLLNDIWAKGDGFYGGNPKNDWITTKEEQTRLYEKVKELETAIRAEIAKL